MTLTLIRGAISDGYMYAYYSILIFTIQSGNLNVTLKNCHNETATVYQFTGMILPNLQPANCKISILGEYFLSFVNNMMFSLTILTHFT